MKKEQFLHEHQRFSIRKYSFGAASVLLGTSLFLAGHAQAAEQEQVSSTVDAPTVFVTDEGNLASSELASLASLDRTSDNSEISSRSDLVSDSQIQANSLASQELSLVSTSSVSETSTLAVADSSSLVASEFATSEQAPATEVHQSESAEVEVTPQVGTTRFFSVGDVATGQTTSDLANSGTYVYKERTELKNEPKLSAPTQFYVNAGDSVNYDQVVAADGYQWISYKSYSGVRRYAPVLPAISGSGKPKEEKVESRAVADGALTIPDKGTFVFQRNTDIKTEPKADLKPTFIFSKGDHVIYDKVLKADGHQWISYLGYDYNRYYADVATLSVSRPSESEKPEVPQTSPSSQVTTTVTGGEKLPASGRYQVTRTLNVKNEPKASAATEFTLEKGYNINYDKVLNADNHQWLSYVSFSGTRRYVDLATLKTVTVKEEKNEQPQPAQPSQPSPSSQVTTTVTGGENLPASGRYQVTRTLNVKNEPKASAPTEFTLEKGYNINYDKVLTADNHQWLSYVSFSGTRRYVELATLKTVEVKATDTKPTEVKPVDTKPSGKVTISNQTSDGFDVIVTNVSSGKTIQEVVVPVWSVKDSQDDLKWYSADKQSDGTYKTHVAVSDHKGDHGEYLVHLYYKIDGKLEGVAATSTIVPETQAVKQELTHSGSYYSVRGKYDDIIIVNKTHGLSAQYNPGENAEAKAAFTRLRDDMIAQGLNVGRSYSGYRTYAYQKNLYDNYVNRDGQAAADRYSARPGFSEHQTGLAFDLTDRSGNLLEDARASQWLKDHAHDYGFIVRYQAGKEASTGYMPEAWHIRYVGQEAKDIHDSGLSLEEYFGLEGGDYVRDNKPVATDKKPNTPNLPSSGRYTFTGRASIKAEPKASSQELAYYDAGMSVNYDKVLNEDGHTWLSYLTFSGARRYVAIASDVSEPSSANQPSSPELPSSGRYTFTGRSSIKAEPKASSQEIAYYDAGMSVNYDKVVKADGHTWLSYLTFSGLRRYVLVA